MICLHTVKRLVGWLVGCIFDISSFLGVLMLNLVCKHQIYMICKQTVCR